MSEAIAFFAGLFAMCIVWFLVDITDNKYMRGYADGLNDGIQEVLCDFEKIYGERRTE